MSGGDHPDLQRLLDDAVAGAGPEAVRRALQHVHLFANLRRQSRVALAVGRELWTRKSPVQLVFTLNPAAEKPNDRCNIRAITGMPSKEVVVRPRV